jgi:hypothetical protein
MNAINPISILTSELELAAPEAEVVDDSVILSVDAVYVEGMLLVVNVLLYEIDVVLVAVKVEVTAKFRLFKSS